MVCRDRRRIALGYPATAVVPLRKSEGYRRGRYFVANEAQGIVEVVNLRVCRSLAMCYWCLRDFAVVSRCYVAAAVMSRTVQPFVVGRLFEGKEGKTCSSSSLEDLLQKRS